MRRTLPIPLLKDIEEQMFDLITVDWNFEQTATWRAFIGKRCPSANIITIQEDPPIPWSKYSSKMRCLLYEFPHPDRVMYMDTDCFVTKDLEPLFEYMEDHDFDLGLSAGFMPHLSPFTGKHSKSPEAMNRVVEAMGASELPPQYSSGMMLFRPSVHRVALYEDWLERFQNPVLVETWGQIPIIEEIALSFALEALDYKIWLLPREVHGNIASIGNDFGNTDMPDVIHYHKIGTLFRRRNLNRFIRKK